MSKTIYVDVAVVGGAGGGLAAAIGAREAGAEKVIILEKQKTLGGTTMVSTGIFGVGSQAQKRLGVKEFTADEAFLDFMKVNNWQVDAKLVRDYINASGSSIDWMEDMGVHFDCVTPCYGLEDRTWPTFHGVIRKRQRTGTVLVKAMRKRVEELEVDVRLQTKAEHLITNDAGEVIGVACTDLVTGEEYTVMAKGGVILATGAFTNNAELMKRLCPQDDLDGIKIMGAFPHCTGDGILMGEEVGAVTGTIGHLWIGPHNHGANCSEITCFLQRRPHPLKVNKLGLRFCDEGLWSNQDYGWMLSVAIQNQPDHRCYVIMDQEMLDKFLEENVYFTNFERVVGREVANDTRYGDRHWLQGLEVDIPGEVEEGRMAVCETLEEVASFVGCDAETLRDTIDTYNGFCDNGYDADFLKAPEHLWPIRKAPYYVMVGVSGLDNYYGGLLIDRNLNCVRKDQTPIHGLYAAGIGTSGWLSNTYCLFGSAFGFTIYSGRKGGENAALRAQGR